MIVNLKTVITNFFSKGHERTLLAKKNIGFSFLLKGFSIVISLLLIPLTIKYINSSQYGVWLTLSSLISWMSFFDIGLGNGLKNRLATANALKDYENAKIYISTTYAMLAMFSIGVFIVFFIFNHFINWNRILNTNSIVNLNQLALLTFGLFCLQFVIQIINTVLTACHSVAKVSFIILTGHVFTLTGVYLLINYTQSSLLLLVLVSAGVPVIIQFLFSIWYYRHDLKQYAPGFKFIDFKYAKELLGLGGVFFLIQIGALVLFQTDNIIIVQLFGPTYVTVFNIAYKLFSIIILSFNIIITPFWSAFTDAYATNDMAWIKLTLRKMRYMWLIIMVFSVLLFFGAPFIYRIWLHGSVNVPVSLSLAMVVYIVAYTWQTIHVYFLNGINKIRLQLYLVIISSIVNIPLAIFLGRKIGLAGVTWSNTIVFIIMGSIFYYQTKKVLDKTATGILNA